METEFVALGDGAKAWLRAATSQGVARLSYKMGYALTLAKATTSDEVERMLDLAAKFHRYQVEDFDSILASLHATPTTQQPHAVESEQSLTQGTNPWVGFGLTNPEDRSVDAGEVVA